MRRVLVYRVVVGAGAMVLCIVSACRLAAYRSGALARLRPRQATARTATFPTGRNDWIGCILDPRQAM